MLPTTEEAVMHQVFALSETGYDSLKLIHVLAAIAWVGAGAYAQVYASRLISQEDLVQLAGFAKHLEKIALIYIMPMSILVIVSGVVLVWLSPLDFTTTWVWLGLIGYAATFVTGAFFLGPEAGRLGKLVDERPAEDPEIQRRIRRILMISRIDLLVLVLVVADMVVKPG
ncbi:MAG: DUF2269 family protein [Actinomycetota bacterium]